LNLLWVLEHTVEAYPRHAKLLKRIIASKHIDASELASPSYADRSAPRPTRRGNTVQEALNL
jgi:hypothetical protein